MFALVILPGWADAIPMDYQIQQGKLRLDMRYGRGSFSIAVPVHGGRFTYDNETGRISDLSVVSYRHGLSFKRPIALGTNDSVWNSGAAGRRLGLRLTGLHLPSGVVPLFISRRIQHLTLRVSALRIGKGIRPVPISPMPEPAGAFLFAAGLLAIGNVMRTRGQS